MSTPSISETDSYKPAELAAAPFGTEAGRAFLQRRVATFARIQGLISLAFLVLDFFTTLAVFSNIPLKAAFFNVTDGFHFAAALSALAIWAIARRGRVHRKPLVWLDLGATFIPMLGYAAMAILAFRTRPDRTDLIMGLIVILVLMLRATFVPSRPRVTTLIGIVSCVPVLVVAYVVGLSYDPKIPTIAFPISAAIWCGAAIFTSTLATHVIYGLRRKAAEAEQLGQYVLDEKLGEGGMGTVYRARHALLRRPTAIKLLPTGKAGEEALTRFEREVRQTSRLTHPNTVAIYDYGHTPDGVFYYAMELLDGLNLQQLVDRSGPQPPSRVVHVLKQVCGSLEEAHGFGLVHRDIKPANIILCERGGIADTAKVVDFGLVKDVKTSGDPTLSTANAILGTPLYLSPEAITSAETIDGRADLYALSAVAYFMLSGEPVFAGNSVIEVCSKHLHETPVPPSVKTGRELPADLEALLLRGLAKRPADRVPSARAFREALAACDIPAWTEDDARRWWTEHQAEPSAPPKRSDTLANSPTVVLVDFDVRRAAGEA